MTQNSKPGRSRPSLPRGARAGQRRPPDMRRQTCAARHAPPDMRRQTGVLLSCIAVQRQSRQMSGAGPTCKGVPSPPSLWPARARGPCLWRAHPPHGARKPNRHTRNSCAPPAARPPVPADPRPVPRPRSPAADAAEWWQRGSCAAARQPES